MLHARRARSYYGVFPYFMAQSIYDTAASLAVPVVFGTIVYFMAGLKVTAEACVLLFFWLTVTIYFHVMRAFVPTQQQRQQVQC